MPERNLTVCFRERGSNDSSRLRRAGRWRQHVYSQHARAFGGRAMNPSASLIPRATLAPACMVLTRKPSMSPDSAVD
jgi:hypothetical protein